MLRLVEAARGRLSRVLFMNRQNVSISATRSTDKRTTWIGATGNASWTT
jgi:hypothetical protein